MPAAQAKALAEYRRNAEASAIRKLESIAATEAARCSATTCPVLTVRR